MNELIWNNEMNFASSLPVPFLLSPSHPQLVAALVKVEWLPDCVAPTFQLMGYGERVFISPKQTHPTASWGLLWRGMWVCVYRGDFSLRFYLQITQMLSFTTSRSCYRTGFFQIDHSLTIYYMKSDASIQLICLLSACCLFLIIHNIIRLNGLWSRALHLYSVRNSKFPVGTFIWEFCSWVLS